MDKSETQTPFFLPSLMQDVFQASFFSPIIPFGSVTFLAQRPVRRLQNKMVFTGERVCSQSALCFSFASDGSHYWAFKACFMSLGVGCPPPLPLFGGRGRGLASLHACMCVSSDGEEIAACLKKRGT